MQTSLSFLGAARNVTGSRYLLEANGARIMVDCGMHQERDLRERDWKPFPVPPESINAILLTHAHLDHSGFITRLVRDGFRGPIYCTSPTSEIARIILLDSAHLQEEDAEFKKKRHQKEGRSGRFPELPLYNTRDAENSFGQFEPVDYEEPVKVADGIEASFYDAGHVLGSAMIKVKVTSNGESRSLVFSGDIGQWDRPILRNPSLFEEADYILVESTYGNRPVESHENISQKLAEVVNSTYQAGGNIVIPSFALERAQLVLYYLNKLLIANRIPHLMVFVDSPMAVSITDVFERYYALFDEEMQKLIRAHQSPFDFSGLKLVRTVDESKAINHIKGTIVIIAGSGMCTGGRIKHHLVTNISRPESTILFVGYQASATLGRQIVEGAKEVRILGQMHPVRAKIVELNGLSAHADQTQLLRWLQGLQKPPRRVFVIHGEPESAQEFATLVRQKTGWNVTIPEYRQTVRLD